MGELCEWRYESGAARCCHFAGEGLWAMALSSMSVSSCGIICCRSDADGVPAALRREGTRGARGRDGEDAQAAGNR